MILTSPYYNVTIFEERDFKYTCFYFRPGSDAARKSKMPEAAQLAAKAAIAADVKKRGAISFWETVT